MLGEEYAGGELLFFADFVRGLWRSWVLVTNWYLLNSEASSACDRMHSTIAKSRWGKGLWRSKWTDSFIMFHLQISWYLSWLLQGCKCECACFMRDRYCPNCGHVRFMCLGPLSKFLRQGGTSEVSCSSMNDEEESSHSFPDSFHTLILFL